MLIYESDFGRLIAILSQNTKEITNDGPYFINIMYLCIYVNNI